MAQYESNVTATTNASANTEDEFIELTAAANTSLLLKRVRVSVQSTSDDNDYTVRIGVDSTAGTGGVAGTANTKRNGAPTSTAAVNVKNGTSAFTLGAVTKSIGTTNLNGRGIYEWIPRGPEEFIESALAKYISVIVKCSVASKVISVSIEWEE